MAVVRVTISLPSELIELARKSDLNISHACRAGLEARLVGEVAKQPDLVGRVEQLEERVRDLVAWRNHVKE